MVSIKPKITALAPWFGSARMNAETIGSTIGKQAWVGIPFCGGCSEVVYIDARQICLNDKHRHIITLAMTVADESTHADMAERLENTLVHPGCLDDAKKVLGLVEYSGVRPRVDSAWAAAYFTVVWLSRSHAGTDSECRQPLATRMTASGGSSVRRWRSALEGLQEWHRILKERCEFTCLDWRTWMAKAHDRQGHAIYADPPWMGVSEYIHTFTEQDHRDLAARLSTFKQCRVVIRHSDHPLYRELYRDWRWVSIGGRNQGNKIISEVLIIND